MSKKIMFYSSAKARRELGYSPRPSIHAFADAVAWFYANGYCGPKARCPVNLPAWTPQGTEPTHPPCDNGLIQT